MVLAFTDYTKTHHESCGLISTFSLARNASPVFKILDKLTAEETNSLVEDIKSEAISGNSVPLKDIL